MTEGAGRYARERNADAGFFEPWAVPTSLDGRPVPPDAPEHTIYGWFWPPPPPEGWATAWLLPQPELRRYYLSVNCSSAARIASGLSGAVRQRQHRYDIGRGHWYIPASSWRPLRAALPRLIALCTASYARDFAAQDRARMQARRDAEIVMRRRHR